MSDIQNFNITEVVFTSFNSFSQMRQKRLSNLYDLKIFGACYQLIFYYNLTSQPHTGITHDFFNGNYKNEAA